MTGMTSPDFTTMDDAALLRWEREARAQLSCDAPLHEIVGTEAARRYHDERGRREL